MIKHSCSAALFLALAACGGGTATPDPDADTGPDPITFQTFADGQAIASEIEDANIALGLMNPADLLPNGTARYQGTAEISSTAGLNAVGVAGLTVEFDSETVFGTATDFVDDTDAPVEGALAMTEGSFDRTGSAGGDITATVTGNFDGLTYIIVPSNISGVFYGDAEGIIIIGDDVAGLVGDEATTYDISIVTELTEE